MNDDEIMKFMDFADSLAKIDSDYGIKKFFKTQNDIKEECFEIIDRIEIIDDTIPSVDRSQKGKLSYEKGLLLENLAKKILNVRNIFCVKERVICDSNEIDLLLQTSTNNLLYQNLLPEYLKKDCLVECKNHKTSIDVTLVGKFYSLMRYKKVKFGFMISNKELTGKSSWEDAIGLTKKLYLRDDTLIINITINMIKDILEKDISIITLIKQQVDEVIYHTNFMNYVACHPGEKNLWQINLKSECGN